LLKYIDTSNSYFISSNRLWNSIIEIAKIGPGVAGGSNRQALSDDDNKARLLFKSWCEEENLEVSVDTLGNMFATRAGKLDIPGVYIGSHLDTQITGGKYDGVLGVLSGLEVIRTLNDFNIQTDHPIVLVNWTNEEGSRFVPSMLGSAVFANIYSLEYAYSRKDKDGITLLDELKRFNWLGSEEIGSRQIHSYFEFHIEQGPILEANKKNIGIVTHGQGQSWLEVTLIGKAVHTGSTPMNMRINAGLAMARIFEKLHQIAMENQPNSAGSVGQVNFYPNSRNALPSKVVFTIDIRSFNKQTFDSMSLKVQEEVYKICEELGVGCSIESIGLYDPIVFDDELIKIVRDSVDQLNYEHMDIVSGAGHDACWISKVAPATMIMCPCVDGISHNESEEISQEWAEQGANVLLRSVLKSAKLSSTNI